MSAVAKTLVNSDEIKNNLSLYKDKKIKTVVPLLEIEDEGYFQDSASLLEHIMSLAQNLPHRRVIITHKVENGEFLIEIHPVTGAA